MMDTAHTARGARSGRGRRPSWSTTLLVLATLLALLAAACATTEDDDTAGDEGTAPATSTTRGITDTTVKVGGIIVKANFDGANVGAAARFARANDEGGVHGRTIELVGVEDDGNDPAANLAAMERLVRQEEVFALVPAVSAVMNADFPQSANVPMFGWGITPAFCGNPVAFGITGCVTDPDGEKASNASGKVLAEHFGGDTDKTVAIITEDNDAGRGGLVLIETSMASQGFDVVYAQAAVPPPPTSVGDYTPFVNALLTSDAGGPPDVILLQVSVASVVGLATALQPVFDGFIMSPFYDPRLVVNPAFEGTGVYTTWSPYEYADESEYLAQMIADIEAYDEANGTDTILALGTAAGYLAAEMFLALLEETGRDLTVETFLAASDGWEWEVPGVVGRSTWPANHDQTVPCAVLVLVENSTYTKDIPLTCGEVIPVE